MCQPARRKFLGQLAVSGLTMTPLAALLSACGKSGWPEGMADIKWDRDTCTRCRMVISDRRFAAELRGGPTDTVLKFDDIGCLAFWLRDKAAEFPWLTSAATRIWVADSGSKPDALLWLNAREAHYVAGKMSPMGYGYAAVSLPQSASLNFADMRQQVLLKGK